MIAQISDPAGNLLFVGVCPLGQDSFTDGERQEFARLMGEIDALVTKAARRRAARAAGRTLDLTAVEPASADDLRKLRSQNGA